MALDFVIVPDFAGPRAARFEAQALFFLASWIEFAGQARRWPLHLACIGEPPPSVRWLAARADAIISVHEPLAFVGRGMANKLRAFDVPRQTDRVVMADSDILVLRDPSDFERLGDGIAAAPATMPQVPFACWERIFAGLDLPFPAERIACTLAEAGLRIPARSALYDGQDSESPAMVPYYNSGVVAAPWDCELRDLWMADMQRIAALFDPRAPDTKSTCGSNQASFATAVWRLRKRGVPFTRLPDTLHTRWPHLYARIVPLRSAVVFHAINIFHDPESAARGARAEVVRYPLSLAKRMVRTLRREPSRAAVWRATRARLPQAIADMWRLGGILWRLHRAHVAPALARA